MDRVDRPPREVNVDKVVFVYYGQQDGRCALYRFTRRSGYTGGVAEQRTPLAGGRWFLGIWINHYNRHRQARSGKRIRALRAGSRGCEERHGSVEKSSGRRKIKTLPNKDYTGEIKDIKDKPAKTLRT